MSEAPAPHHAEEAPGHPGVLRITAPNPGPMTLAGTNTYIVGAAPCWVIDPGPADRGHIDAVRDAGETRGGIAGVLLTHSHADHGAGIEMLAAPVVFGEAGSGDELSAFAAAAAEAGGPLPSNRAPGEQPGSPGAERVVELAAGRFRVVPTPGHSADHACFVVDPGEDGVHVCFCGDLILGEGSSIVPPAAGGGSLADYMSSLDRAAALDADLLCPGHGPWITDPPAKIAEYRSHRLEREQKLLAALDRGERDRERLLDAAWDDVPEQLRPAAALAMQAHLEKLADEGRLPA